MFNYHTVHKIILGDLITPVSAYMKVRDDYPQSALMESSDYHSGENSRSFIALHPIASVAISHGKAICNYPDSSITVDEVNDHFTTADAINQFLKHFTITGEKSNYCGLYGYTSFNAVRYFENINIKDETQQKNDAPDMLYILYKDVVVFDHFSNTLTIIELMSEGEEEDLEDKSDLAFGWNDWGIADFTVVMHAHEGTPAAEWVKNYPHVISPQGVESMDAEGYAEVCTRVMRESGYPEAEICYNPGLKWMAVKPLVAYNLDHAVAVFRNSGKTLLCGFEALNGEWELQWVNEQFLEVSSLPVMLAYFGEDYLRIILPDPSDPDVDNAVDYWFDAQTLTLVKATYVTGYLWYDNEDVWKCRAEGEKLVYSYAEHMERDEEGNWVEVEEEEFSTVDANEEDLVLSTGKRLPVYPKGFVIE